MIRPGAGWRLHIGPEMGFRGLGVLGLGLRCLVCFVAFVDLGGPLSLVLLLWVEPVGLGYLWLWSRGWG